MVEAAIVIPILCMVLFAIVQFGITFNNYLTLTDSVRAGAREASVSREASDPVGATVSAVRSSASDLNQSNLTVSVTSSLDARQRCHCHCEVSLFDKSDGNCH